MSGNILQASVCLALTAELPVLSVSEGIEALIGFTPEDFLSSRVSLKERIHPHDSDIADALFSPEIQSGPGAFNIRLRHADGRIRCIKGQYTKEADAGGQVVLDLLLQDARSFREEVDETPMMARFRAMMENSEDYIYFKDRNHVFTAVSQTTVPSNDKRMADVIGMTDYELMGEEAADALYRLEKQIFAGLPTGQKIHEIQTGHGRRCYLDNRMYPIKALNGEITGVWGIARDITRQFLAEETLRESEELLKLFTEHAPASLAMLDRELRYLAVSRRYIEERSLVDREIIGHSVYEILPNLPESWKEAHRRGLTGEVLRGDEDRYPRADGTEGWMRWEIHPWLTGNGAVGGIVIFAEDITVHRQAEERLRLAARVFTHASEGIVITAANGAIIDVNNAFTQITGYTREEVLGRNPRLLKSGRQGREFYAEMWRTLLEKDHWSGEIWNRGKNGRIYPEMLTISAVKDESGEVQQYVSLFFDITTIKEQEQQLKHLAHYDVLTGLPNRVLLADRLNQAMVQTRRRGKLVAVVYLDLDGFKAINDCHGHDAGDQLLAMVAKRMKKVLRKGDTIARLGGDEFVAVLLDLENTEASIPMLDRLLKVASQPVQFGDFALQVTASIGVTFYLQAEEAIADQLLRQADQAMYQAKLAGRNRYHIFDFNQDSIARNGHVDLDRVPPLPL